MGIACVGCIQPCRITIAIIGSVSGPCIYLPAVTAAKHQARADIYHGQKINVLWLRSENNSRPNRKLIVCDPLCINVT